MITLHLIPALAVVAMATAQFYPNCPDNPDACRANAGDLVCSGRGECLCGNCNCYTRDSPREIVSGQFCECDNFSCSRWTGLLCGGPDHGTCECGQCRCRPGWVGEACDCSTSQDSCIQPGTTEVCSGKGSCECGVCKCSESEEGRFSGKYCEDCPTCKGRCSAFRPCVECKVFNSGSFRSNCTQSCADLTINKQELGRDLASEDYFCSFHLESTIRCRYKFIYSGSSGVIYVPPKQKCFQLMEVGPGGGIPGSGPAVRSEFVYVLGLFAAVVFRAGGMP